MDFEALERKIARLDEQVADLTQEVSTLKSQNEALRKGINGVGTRVSKFESRKAADDLLSSFSKGSPGGGGDIVDMLKSLGKK